MAFEAPEYAIEIVGSPDVPLYDVLLIDKGVGGTQDYIQATRVATFDTFKRAADYCDIYRGKEQDVE